MRILLIEDSDADALIVRRMLARHMARPHEIAHVRSMAEAYQILHFSHQKVDAVLLDLSLPDASSQEDIQECISWVREDIPVLVLTSRQDRDLAVRLVESCVEDFIPKSVLTGAPEILSNAIEFAVCRRKKFIALQDLKNWELKERERMIDWGRQS